jgi:hypothetical protein
MTLKERFETLHPDIVRAFLSTGKSEAIPEELQRYILILDRVPELQRRYPSITRCARELMKLHPHFNLAFHTAREIIYDAMNYFHLNSTVRNEAWNNYYADRAEELHHICVKMGNLKTAGVYLKLAKEWRHNPNENSLNGKKIGPVLHVLSPAVTPQMLGISGKYSLKTISSESLKKFKEAEAFINKLDINSDEKDRLRKEAALSYNIEDIDPEDDN